MGQALEQLVSESRLQVRTEIDALEDSLRAAIDSKAVELTHHDAVTDEGNAEGMHFFGDGVYVRGVEIPAGCMVVGKIHKQRRVCIVAKGTCSFVDEFSRQIVTAPWCGEFNSDSKTAVYAHTDTVWYACVGTDITDPQEAIKALSGDRK